jgi:Suppressor of fused protein (SUFU)
VNMTPEEAKHRECTVLRAKAYGELFGDKPVAVFPAYKLRGESDGPYWIDVFVYQMEMEGDNRSIYVAVTNGMSDQRMADGDSPDQPRRPELIQYFRECSESHAKRLRDMAWLPLKDGFLLHTHHSFAWEWPAVEGSPWKNAFFLLPLPNPHREFTFQTDGDEVSFLWHIPISDQEHAFKREHGADALLDRMEEVGLPWIFEEANRPSLVGQK